MPLGAQRLAWAESAVIHFQTALETLEEAFHSTKGVNLVLATSAASLGPTVDVSGRSIGFVATRQRNACAVPPFRPATGPALASNNTTER